MKKILNKQVKRSRKQKSWDISALPDISPERLNIDVTIQPPSPDVSADAVNQLSVDSLVNQRKQDQLSEQSIEQEDELNDNLKELIKQLKNQRESIVKYTGMKPDNTGIASKELGNKTYQTWNNRLQSIKDVFNDIKTINPKEAILSSISQKYSDITQYRKDQRNLGSKASNAELNKMFDRRNAARLDNERNERLLHKNLGGLSKEEFLAGNSEVARRYKAEQQRIGTELKETDLRHTLYDKKPEPVTSKLATTLQSVKTGIPSSLSSMVNSADVDTNASTEAKMESDLVSKTYHDADIAGLKEQTVVLNGQLKVQKDILEELKKIGKIKETKSTDTDKSDDSDGTGFFDWLFGKDKKPKGNKTPRKEPVFDDDLNLPDNKSTPKPTDNKVPSKKGGLRGVLSKGKDLLKTGANAAKGLGRAATPLLEGAAKVATPIAEAVMGEGALAEGAALAAGTIGAPVLAAAGTVYAAHEGAKSFADSFGEGGFDLIQELRHKDIISYGWSTTPKVDKWEGIEQLSADQLKVLINTDEFEGDDLKKIQSIYKLKSEEVTPIPQPVAPVSENIIPSNVLITPKNDATNLYQQSADNAALTTKPTEQQPQTINAPVTNISNNTTKQTIKDPLKNTESSIKNMFSGRHKFNA